MIPSSFRPHENLGFAVIQFPTNILQVKSVTNLPLLKQVVMPFFDSDYMELSVFLIMLSFNIRKVKHD